MHIFDLGMITEPRRTQSSPSEYFFFKEFSGFSLKCHHVCVMTMEKLKVVSESSGNFHLFRDLCMMKTGKINRYSSNKGSFLEY